MSQPTKEPQPDESAPPSAGGGAGGDWVRRIGKAADGAWLNALDPVDPTYPREIIQRHVIPAIISEISAAGYAVVRREPTERMVKWCEHVTLPGGVTTTFDEAECRGLWQAMLQASEEEQR